MKKTFIFSILLFLTLSLFVLPTNNVKAAEGGLSFSSAVLNKVEKTYSAVPRTIEAEVYLPTSYTTRAGVIFGNYGGTSGDFSFEVQTNGKLRFFYDSLDKGDISLVSSVADVRTGSWAHVAVSFDYANKCVNFYIDGVLKDSMAITYDLSSKITDYNCVLGGDNRSDNSQYFKGQMKNVAVYSD